MTRVNSDIRMRIVGVDNSGPAVNSAMRHLDQLEQKAQKTSRSMFGVGFGGGNLRNLPFGLKFGGATLGLGVAAASMQRSLSEAAEAFKHFRLPPETLPQIQRMNSYLSDTWRIVKAFPGIMAGEAGKFFGMGPGYVPAGKVPSATIEPQIGQRSQDLPSVRLAAAELERAKQIEAQIQADEEATEEMRNRAGQQTGLKSIALNRALMFQGSGEQFLRVFSSLRDVGLNMGAGLQNNLRGLGTFGTGVGRAFETLGIGDRFGRRGEREEMAETAMDPYALRVKRASEKWRRFDEMIQRGEIDKSLKPGFAKGLLREFGLEADTQRRGVAPSGSRFLTMGQTQDPIARAQGKTNELLKAQVEQAKLAVNYLKNMAGQPVVTKGPGF